MTTNIRSLIQNLDVDGVVELFELNLSPITGSASDRYLMFAGTNQNDVPVTWNGEVYNPYPFEMRGFEKRTQGTQPRPSLAAGNASGLLTSLSLAYDDLVGAQVIRRKTLVRFLDRVNFPPRRNLLVDTVNWGSSWTQSALAVTALGSTGPAVSANVLKIVQAASNAQHAISQAGLAGDYTSPVTFSFWVMDAGQRFIRAELQNAGASATAVIDLALGKVVSTGVTGGATIGSTSTMKMGDQGWFRVSMTADLNSAAAATARITLMQDASTAIYMGNGTSGVSLCAPQVEQASAASAYQAIVGTTYDPNPDADPTQKFPDELWYIERKVKGNRNSYEWELVTATDLEGFQLPARPISANVCPWAYKGGDPCNYSGSSYFDAQDNPVASASQDVCSKSLNGCKKRFGASAVLPFGGMPGARSYRI
jgi:phage-related protein